MASFNQWTGIGNATRDPLYKTLPGGSSVAEFGLACNHKYKTRDGADREDVLFIDCSAFGRQAEVINNFVKKGKQLLVCGRLVMHQWDDKQSGAKRSKISVVVEQFQFIGGRDAQSDDDGGSRPPQRQPSRGPSSRPKTNLDQTYKEPFDESGIPVDEIPFAWHDPRTPA